MWHPERRTKISQSDIKLIKNFYDINYLGSRKKVPGFHQIYEKPKCMVKINNKPILEHNLNFFNKFKKKIITGYKNTYLKKFIKKNKFKEIYNKNYTTTNMVYSMFLAKKYIDDDILVVYGDIIFNEDVYELLKNKKILFLQILTVYLDW